MQSDAEVTAADIARLAGVGRAAVSNWRKRFADFPQPVGGTAASPAYRLADVEKWLRANDRLPATTPMDTLWLAVQHAAAHFGSVEQAILHVGEALLATANGKARSRSPLPADVRAALADATATGVDVFESLLKRHGDVQGRRGSAVTPVDVARLMAQLADVAGASVLDPACGSGGLLHQAAAAGATHLAGQDDDPDLVALADVRLGLASGATRYLRRGSLRDDAFADSQVDVVLCDPPYGQRDWGHDELTFDGRWEYELPPRSESELAWVQHALAKLRPGGRAVVLLPPAVASRPAGRRVRNALVRRGALRAVIALPAGVASPAHLPLHLWLLRRPDRAGPPPDLLLADMSSQPWPDCADAIARVAAAYRDHGRIPPLYGGFAMAVPLLDLVDEEIDLTPARHLARERPRVEAAAVRERRDALSRAVAALPDLVPDLAAGPAGPPSRMVAVSDLIRSGHLTLLNPTEVDLQRGDVLVQTAAARPRCAVVRDPAAVPVPDGPLVLLRPDPEHVDPWFVAGFIGREANVRLINSLGSSRLDVRRARLPHLPLVRQQEYGRWFERLDEFDRAVREVSSLSTEVVHLIAEGLASGALGGEA